MSRSLLQQLVFEALFHHRLRLSCIETLFIDFRSGHGPGVVLNPPDSVLSHFLDADPISI